MLIDLSGAEFHNVVVKKGRLTTRRGLYGVKTPSEIHRYVGGFSIESPFTTEVWHYLFEQNTATLYTTLRVYTEEFVEIYSFNIGTLPRNPVISHAVYNNQIMVNSPSFSAPLYGIVGGGMITALKTESTVIDTTALEIPTGHICSFGDRMPIAEGNVVYFNDAGLDPRTYVAQNAMPMPGTVYDIFQSLDGSLYIGHSNGVSYLASDALGKGQTVEGFLGLIPGIQLSRPRNMAVSNGVVMALQRDGMVVVGGRGQKVSISTYEGPRYYSKPVEVDDLRLAGEIFATPDGFLVGFSGKYGYVLDFNLRENYQSFIWKSGVAINLVGTLRSRENDTLMILEDRVVMPVHRNDVIGVQSDVQAVLAIDSNLPEGIESMLRRVTTSSDNIGESISVYGGHRIATETVPARSADTVIGSSQWSSSTKYRGRRHRSVRHSFAERMTNMPIEVTLSAGGGPRTIESGVSIDLRGQGRKRGDAR